MEAVPGIRRTIQREALVRDLLVNGTVFDKSGGATIKLHKRMNFPHDPKTLSGIVTAAERDGIIGRVINGKRCYKIFLKNNPWPDLEDKAIEELENGHQEPEEIEETETSVSEPQFDAEEVARKLLQLVLERASSSSHEEALQEKIETLNTALQDADEANKQLTLKIRELQDELSAKKHECDGLRNNVRVLGEQMDKIIREQHKAQKLALNEGQERLMRDLMSAPKHTGH